MLCRRHNEALSPLDATAHRFFSFILGKSSSTELLLPGYELERWFLKLLCGMMSKGLGTVAGQRIPAVLPERGLVQTLFEAAPIPKGCGVSFMLEDRVESLSSMHVYIMANERAGVFGCGLRLGYCHTIFTLGPITSTPKRDGKAGFMHHPSCLLISGHGPDREVHFGWTGGGIVNLVIRPPGNEQ